MIPLRDNIPHRRKPVITTAILVLNVVVFLYQLGLGGGVESFIKTYGFVPQRLSLSSISLGAKLLPLFSSMFIHGGFLHLAGNCLYLWIFADNVEDKLGHVNFLIFYLVCGVAASLLHALFNLSSKVPAIGASGAIAGVLGAYFLMFPRARVVTLLPLFIFWQIIEIPAFFFLGFWFVLQFLFGLVSLGATGAEIAFWAHIGGFISGMLLVKLFMRRRFSYRFS